MKGLKVAEVSELVEKFSVKHFKRFMTHPYKKRMEILENLARKVNRGKTQNHSTPKHRYIFE